MEPTQRPCSRRAVDQLQTISLENPSETEALASYLKQPTVQHWHQGTTGGWTDSSPNFLDQPSSPLQPKLKKIITHIHRHPSSYAHLTVNKPKKIVSQQPGIAQSYSRLATEEPAAEQRQLTESSSDFLAPNHRKFTYKHRIISENMKGECSATPFTERNKLEVPLQTTFYTKKLLISSKSNYRSNNANNRNSTTGISNVPVDIKVIQLQLGSYPFRQFKPTQRQPSRERSEGSGHLHNNTQNLFKGLNSIREKKLRDEQTRRLAIRLTHQQNSNNQQSSPQSRKRLVRRLRQQVCRKEEPQATLRAHKAMGDDRTLHLTKNSIIQKLKESSKKYKKKFQTHYDQCQQPSEEDRPTITTNLRKFRSVSPVFPKVLLSI